MRSVFLFYASISLVFMGCTTTKTEPQYAATSIFPPIQTPFKETPVALGRVSWIYGDHDKVSGADVGVVGNIVNNDFNGMAVSGIFHATNGKAAITPLQFSGATNINSGTAVITGIQMSALANLGKKTVVRGLQFATYNEADKIYGFQIGLINKTNSLYGVQIGLANFSKNNGLPFCPVLNIGF